MISFYKETDEVLYTKEELFTLKNNDILELKKMVLNNKSKKIRICSHKNIKDKLHEMFIVQTKDCYIRPHKHLDKVESMSILEGAADVLLFDDNGKIKKIIKMGENRTKKTFYYRLDRPVYHMLLIKSDFLVYHEVTQGPFDSKMTVFPDWAPPEDDSKGLKVFLKNIESNIL